MFKESTPPPRPKRLVQLDVLRGVAILLVLFRHSIVPWSYAGLAIPFSRGVYYLGWTGVDLFFVLSGFLIGGLLFKEIRSTGRLDIPRFLLRRGLKIWPGYFALVLFAFVEFLWHEHAAWPQALRKIAPNLLHLQNYFGSPRGLTWSLAVEEHFYLALPLFLLVVTARWRRVSSIPAVPVMAIALILGCTALRVVFHWNNRFDMWHDLAPTHLRIDGLFFGVMLAYLHHLKPHLLAQVGRYRYALLLIGLALVLPMGRSELGTNPFIWTIGFTMLYLGYACILVAFVYTPRGEGILGKALASRPAAALAWVGVFSYSIYLWQFDLALNPLERYVLPHLPHHPISLYWAVGMSIYLAAAIVTGAIMAKLIEMPVLAVRDRLFPSPVASPIAQPPPIPARDSERQPASSPVPEPVGGGIDLVSSTSCLRRARPIK